MQSKHPRKKDDGKLAQLRLLRDLLIPIQIIAVLAAAVYLVLSSGYRSVPLYIPLLAALPLLVIALAVIALEFIVFRALEIQWSHREGQKYLLVDLSWRNAQKVFAIALIVAVLLLVPPVQSLALNSFSPTAQRSIQAAGTLPLPFYSQDALGISHARSLQVVVETGALRVTIQEGASGPSRGADLAAGQQRTFTLASTAFLLYNVSFENLAGGTTIFTYKVNVGLPTGFINLVAILMTVIAVSNLVWLFYLRPQRAAEIKGRPPRARPARRPRRRRRPPQPRPWGRQPARARPPAPYRWPWQPGQRAPYPVPRMWNPVYAPWSAYARPRPAMPPAKPPEQPPPKREPPRREPGEELPPPPAHVDPYEVEGSPPPLTVDADDSDRSALQSVGTDISGLLDKAEDRVALGDFKEALEDYETVLNLDRRNLSALLKKAELLRRVGRSGEAMELLDRALEVDPWHAGALLGRASLLEEQERYDQALECYDAVLQGGPAVLLALVAKGDVMARMGEGELAWEAYTEAHRLAPEDPELQKKIRAIEEGHGGTLDPQSPGFLIKKARATARAGKLEEALQMCEAVAEEATDDPALWALKGALEADLGLQAPAIESLRRAIELDPEDRESARRLDGLTRHERERDALGEILQEVGDLTPEAIAAVVEEFQSLQKLKRVKVKTLAGLEGVTVEQAKAILRRIRSGR